MSIQHNTLESLAPHGATHYEVKGHTGREAGYLRLNQEGLWDFWSTDILGWVHDDQMNNSILELKIITLRF